MYMYVCTCMSVCRPSSTRALVTCTGYRLANSQNIRLRTSRFTILLFGKRLRQRKSIHCSRNTFLISRDTLVHYFIMTSPIPINNTYQRSSNKDHEMFVTPPASPNKQVNLDSVFVWCGVLLKMGGHPRWNFHPFAIVVVFSHFFVNVFTFF